MKYKWVRRALMAALALAALWAAAPALADGSGKCGDNLTYILSNGTLTISGTGPMYDYSAAQSETNAPWYDRNTLKKVIIRPGVTSIGKLAFGWCMCLSELEIADSVTSIGEEAFCYCHSLKNLTIPSGVRTVSRGAFYRCDGLERLTIPGQVTSLMNEAFAYSNVENVYLSDSVKYIGPGAFKNCDKLTDVYYTGTLDKATSISFHEDNDPLLEANWYYSYTPQHTVVFDANGGYVDTSSMVVTDFDPYGALPTPEYYGNRFIGWYTAREGGYEVCDHHIVHLGEDQILYAHWTPISYTLQFIVDGEDPPESVSGFQVTIPSYIPTHIGWDFLGWKPRSSGADATRYKPGDVLLLSSNMTLSAVWRYGGVSEMVLSDPVSTSVNLDLPGAPRYIVYNFREPGRYVVQSHGSYDTVAELYDSSRNSLVRNDDGGDSFNFRIERDLEKGLYFLQVRMLDDKAAPGEINVTLERAHYAIHYSANGGTGAPDEQTKRDGTDIILSTVKPVWAGHTFMGWALSYTATEPEFQPGDTFTRDADSTLYAVWAEEKKTFDVVRDAYAFVNDASSFGYGYTGPGPEHPIKYNPIFKLIYGDSVAGKFLYQNMISNKWGGNCCGMACSVALFLTDDRVLPNQFGRDNVVNLGVGDSNGAIDIRTFIEAMQVAQFSTPFTKEYQKNLVYGKGSLNALVSNIRSDLKAGRTTLIAVGKHNVAGHALLAYGLEEVSPNELRVSIYDCNSPGVARTLNLWGSGGTINQWSYEMGGKYGTWGSDSTLCFISDVTYATVEYIWEHRGNLNDQKQTLSTDNENLSVTDANGNEVARVEDGRLVYADADVLQLPVLSTVWPEGTTLFLPKDFYTVTATDGGSLSAAMADAELSAEASTTTGSISFSVDSDSGENTVLIEDATASDSYSVSLGSGISGVHYQSVSVIGSMAVGGAVRVSGSQDELSIGESNIESLVINGEERNSFLISASASQGGSIIPGGDCRVDVNGEQTYSFQPELGWELERVRVDGEDVEVDPGYTFTGVLRDHTISADFRLVNGVENAQLNRNTGVLDANVISRNGGRVVAAVYDDAGRMLAVCSKSTVSGNQAVRLALPVANLPSGIRLKVLLLDERWRPMCHAYESVY